MGISEQTVQNNKKQLDKQANPKVININSQNHWHLGGKIIEDGDKNSHIIIFIDIILADSVGEIACQIKVIISNRELQVGDGEWEVDEEKLWQFVKTVCIKVRSVSAINESHDLEGAIAIKTLTPINISFFKK